VNLRAPFPAAIAVLVLPVLTLAACSSTDDSGAIAIAASEKACKVENTRLGAGATMFKVTNDGGDVTEVYVYADGDQVTKWPVNRE